MRELSSLSSPKASLSLSSPGEPSLTANSNLSRQFGVCQAPEPTHRFNLFNHFSLDEPNLTIAHVPREHRHGPADINLSLLHPSGPLFQSSRPRSDPTSSSFSFEGEDLRASLLPLTPNQHAQCKLVSHSILPESSQHPLCLPSVRWTRHAH